MGKLWSLLFLATLIFGVAMFIYGPAVGAWLPPLASEGGLGIDRLYMFILWLTGIVFVATEGVLFWFLWKYNSDSNPQPVKFTHGSHTLEVVWTILPAVTLLFIAIYQMNAWAEAKMRVPKEGDPNVVVLEIRARQFEWRVRYPGIHVDVDPSTKLETVKRGKLGESALMPLQTDSGPVYGPGELFTVNDIHVPVNKMILIHLKSEDVLHSFFLPNMRVKQDAVPGMTIPVWFRPTEEGTYDLACSQLCGWGHYKMMGRLTVESEDRYREFLQTLDREQNATQPPPPAKVAEDKSE